MVISTPPIIYLMDANALIDFGERYYADDVFGALWKLLRDALDSGTVVITKGVMDEIKKYTPLPPWRQSVERLCKGKLIDESAYDVQIVFGRLARDIASKKVTSDLSEADQLLLACGEALSYLIVSSDGGVRNTCARGHIKAHACRPLDFLRAVGWTFP